MESSDPIRESLLVHASFVQQLARRLAGPDGDDLAQDTWTAALRAGAANVRGVRQWLATIAANLWRNRSRDDARRLRRELAATTAPASCPSVAEILQREEARREVVAAVVALPERLRTVVLLRFFEGLDSTAIGERLGLPASTVRAQLQQALARLRRQLDERHGDDRAAWSAPLLGCAGAAAAASPSLPLLLGIGWPLRIALAAVLVLLVWLGVGLAGGPPAVPPGPRAVPPVVAGGDRGAAEPTRDAAGVAERTEVAAAAAPWTVRGEVMHGSVAPLPGAHFRAQLFAGVEADGEPLAVAELVSDEAGAFAWSLPRPDGVVTLRFAQSRADTRLLGGTRVVLPDDGPPQDLTVYVFLVDCRVHGRVLDADGQPIAGAWVKSSWTADEPQQPCAADGSYALTTVATYGDTTVIAGAPGCVLRSQTAKVAGAAAEVTLDFRLARAARLQGRVLDEAGAGIAGARVYTFATRSAAVRTDADGRFELDHVDPTRSRHTLQAEADGYLTAQLARGADELAAPLDLVLRRGVRIAGRVFGSDGRPVVAARLRLLMQDDLRPFVYATSHADGSFAFAAAPAGVGSLRVFARGLAPAFVPLSITGASAVPEVVVRLERGHFLAGRITDRHGAGLHRVRLTPLKPGKGSYTELGEEVHSRPDGTFRLDGLPAGSIDLDCFGAGLAGKREPGLEVDRSDLTIVMERQARLAGRVVDDTTGQALPRFTIRLVMPELHAGEQGGGGYGVEWARGVTFTDTDGCWTTDSERLEAGMVFGVEASAKGYGPLLVRRVVAQPGAEPADLLLRLRPAARIAGRVVQQRTGAGIAGVRLTVVGAGPAPVMADLLRESGLSCRTEADGSFAIDGVPAGEMSLVCQHADWPLTVDGPFATAAGATATRTVALPPPATLTLVVLGPHGEPVGGARFVREPEEEIAGVRVPLEVATTDAQGRCRFAGLSTASYLLRGSGQLADGSTIVHAERVAVTAGEDRELLLQPAGTGALAVELACEQPLPGELSLRLWRAGAGAEAVPFVARVSGPNCTVRGLPPGDYHACVAQATQTTMVSGEATAAVAAAKTTPLRIVCSVRDR